MNSNCNCSCACDNGSQESKRKPMTEEERRIFFGFMLSILGTFILVLTCLIISYIYRYIQSKKFREATKTPGQPNWMLEYELSSYRKTYRDHFLVYTKHYTIRTYTEKGETKECSKNVMRKIRKILEELFEVTVDTVQIPDGTCIISIPKRNFKCGSRPGEFESIHGGPTNDSFYEYQMIGDDRIQVTYFVVGGVRHVAGLCIYIVNPYQSCVFYRGSIIKQLIRAPIYWSKYNWKEEKMKIVSRDFQGVEPMLVTNNRYGVTKYYRINRDEKDLESCSFLPYGYREQDEMGTQLRGLTVNLCKSRNEFVIIAEKNGEKVHAIWNKKTKRIDFFKCASCDSSDDTPPPAYESIV